MNITLELAQKIINYLITRPYSEVAVLISELQREATKSIQDQQVKPGASQDMPDVKVNEPIK